MTEPPEIDPRAPLFRGDYARSLNIQKKTARQWLSEPGSKLVVLAVAGFFAVVWGFCFLTALMLSSSAGGEGLFGANTFGRLILMASALFGFMLGMWALMSMVPRILGGESGFLDRFLVSLFRKSGVAPELDESPARLARKRGDPAGALRLYRQWSKEFPHRVELYYFIAEIEHKDLGDRDAGLRGYRDFLKRLSILDREQTPREREYVPLAEAYIADLERAPEPPKPRRVIKV